MVSAPNAFLIDANVFITPYNSFYPFDLVPAFWEFMKRVIEEEKIAVLDLVYEEIIKGEDDLSSWIKSIDFSPLNHKDELIIAKYGEVINYIQQCEKYNEKALADWADAKTADPWIVACGMAYKYSIITFESSAGKITNPSSRAKIPDVCNHFELSHHDLYHMMRELSFNGI